MIATKELAPTPTSVPNAAHISINGLATVNPDNAIAPTPCPIKIESTMLYKDMAVMAIIPGVAYLNNKLRIEAVPSSVILGADIYFQTFVLQDVHLVEQ